MKKIVLALLALAVPLTACTGTSEPRPETTVAPPVGPEPVAMQDPVQMLEDLAATADARHGVDEIQIAPWGASLVTWDSFDQTRVRLTQFHRTDVEPEHVSVPGDFLGGDLAALDPQGLVDAMAGLGCDETDAIANAVRLPGGLNLMTGKCISDSNGDSFVQYLGGQTVEPLSGGINSETLAQAFDLARLWHGDRFSGVGLAELGEADQLVITAGSVGFAEGNDRLAADQSFEVVLTNGLVPMTTTRGDSSHGEFYMPYGSPEMTPGEVQDLIAATLQELDGQEVELADVTSLTFEYWEEAWSVEYSTASGLHRLWI